MPAGRKWFDGKGEDETVKKLKTAFAIGCTVNEACIFAEISRTSYYEYLQQHDRDLPEDEKLANVFDHLKDTPILKARNTVVKSLSDPEHAKWFLERKRKDEFSTRSEFTGKDGKGLNEGLSLDDPEIGKIREKAEEELRKLLQSRLKKAK